MKIKWRRGSDGRTESHCGRWMIWPLYCGSTRPQAFEVFDKKIGKKRGGWDLTQREAKETAQRILDREKR